MRAYSIFDDFPIAAAEILNQAGIEVTVHPLGVPRPNNAQMKSILQKYEDMAIFTPCRKPLHHLH